jgi:hypothetical protein
MFGSLRILDVLKDLSCYQRCELVALVELRRIYHLDWHEDARIRRDLLKATEEADARTNKLRTKLRRIVEALNEMADYVESIERTRAGEFWLGIAENASFTPAGFDDNDEWQEGNQPPWNPVPHSPEIREDARRYAEYLPGVPDRIKAEVEAILGSEPEFHAGRRCQSTSRILSLRRN